MCFLYLFDLLDFDENGQVCATGKVDLSHARSNFLYLVSKYNQVLLQEDKLALPAFFKEELSAVLNDVEAGGDFEKAKKQVLENCILKVQAVANGSDKELVSALCAKISLKDLEFAEKFKKATNNLQLAYIITSISGIKMDSINKTLSRADWTTENLDKRTKSNLYKDIITYNSLVRTAEKVKNSKNFALEQVLA